jgi:hypothetical protein
MITGSIVTWIENGRRRFGTVVAVSTATGLAKIKLVCDTIVFVPIDQLTEEK